MPMEHEIADLKGKLGEAEERVKELEASKVGEYAKVCVGQLVIPCRVKMVM